LIPAVVEKLDLESSDCSETVRQGVDFIRSYADKFHHAKEEAILFKYFDEKLDIIKTICADHENARALVKSILVALDCRDSGTVSTQLQAYRDLLTEHIKKEDDVLYRWMDRNLSMTQVGELFSRFRDKNRDFGDTPARYTEMILKLEGKLGSRRSDGAQR
jgi:hemerythrin-like domain-containing protein